VAGDNEEGFPWSVAAASSPTLQRSLLMVLSVIMFTEADLFFCCQLVLVGLRDINGETAVVVKDRGLRFVVVFVDNDRILGYEEAVVGEDVFDFPRRMRSKNCSRARSSSSSSSSGSSWYLFLLYLLSSSS
jgi:hypothetical protein